MSKQLSSQKRREILDVFDAPDSDAEQVYTFETSELTALCPFDFGGPDFYDVELRYVPEDRCLESKSLKKYIESFRSTEITAEELGAEMYSAFDEAVAPNRMYLRLEQARRGGIQETVEFGDGSLRQD
jgi:7-cyano-7-deazaguanine reductase